MIKIAVINQKGGVGKTTTTANLGAALAKAGKRVLLIDMDPQGHLSLHFGLEISDEQLSVYDLLTDHVPLMEVAHKVRDLITIVPADIHLAGAEAELVSVMGREVILREALESVEDDFDYLLIDCPPSVGVLTVNALAACDEVLVPLQAQFFALQGFAKLLEKTVTLVQRRINPPLTVRGIILCLHESATRLAGEVVEDIELFVEHGRTQNVPWSKATLFERRIRRNIKLAEACSFGKSIFDYAPRSNGATDYLLLAHEIFPEAEIPIPSWMRRCTKPAAASRSRLEEGTGDDGSTAAHSESVPKSESVSKSLPDTTPDAASTEIPNEACSDDSARTTACHEQALVPPQVQRIPPRQFPGERAIGERVLPVALREPAAGPPPGTASMPSPAPKTVPVIDARLSVPGRFTDRGAESPNPHTDAGTMPVRSGTAKRLTPPR